LFPLSAAPRVPLSLLPQTRFLWVSGALWAPRIDPRSGLVFLVFFGFHFFSSYLTGLVAPSQIRPLAPKRTSRPLNRADARCKVFGVKSQMRQKKKKTKIRPRDGMGVRLSSVPRNGVCFKNARISRRSWRVARAVFNFFFLSSFTCSQCMAISL
jgi:hypothetical protein